MNFSSGVAEYESNKWFNTAMDKQKAQMEAREEKIKFSVNTQRSGHPGPERTIRARKKLDSICEGILRNQSQNQFRFSERKLGPVLRASLVLDDCGAGDYPQFHTARQ